MSNSPDPYFSNMIGLGLVGIFTSLLDCTEIILTDLGQTLST
jgi:hypothetical protein